MNTIETRTWNEETWQTAKVWLRDQLKVNRATVTFEKVDGTLRTMTCSLRPEDLPPLVESLDDRPRRVRAENPDTLSVYDLEKSEWRSFRVRSLKTVEL